MDVCTINQLPLLEQIMSYTGVIFWGVFIGIAFSLSIIAMIEGVKRWII